MKPIDAKTKNLKLANLELKDQLNGNPVILKNTGHLHGLAAGLKHGEVIIQGDCGDYLGVLNDGATIHATQNVGKYLADNMTRGTVIVDGDAQYGPGQYCYGGTIVIRGNAGDFTATMNKGATILIAGDVGDEVGTYMLKGDLIVVGNAGKNFANYLIRGSVFIGGKWENLGHNTRVVPIDDQDVARLRKYFETYQIDADPQSFKKIVAASEKPFYN
jgi:methylamine---glutamate N-methyltransferase subunit B